MRVNVIVDVKLRQICLRLLIYIATLYKIELRHTHALPSRKPHVKRQDTIFIMHHLQGAVRNNTVLVQLQLFIMKCNLYQVAKFMTTIPRVIGADVLVTRTLSTGVQRIFVACVSPLCYWVINTDPNKVIYYGEYGLNNLLSCCIYSA